jgi:phosphohistidine phosphatase
VVETRTLLLLRHAEAETTRPGHRDRDRRLSERGRAQAAEVGATIRAHGWTVDRALCSPALRARETLAGLALPEDVEIEVVESLYDAGSDAIIELVRTLPKQVRCALVVGHAPAIPGVLHELVDPVQAEPTAWSLVEARFPPATLAGLTLDGWPDLTGIRLSWAAVS